MHAAQETEYEENCCSIEHNSQTRFDSEQYGCGICRVGTLSQILAVFRWKLTTEILYRNAQKRIIEYKKLLEGDVGQARGDQE